jgi:glucokinase
MLVREEVESMIPQMVGGRLEAITAQTVYDAAKAEDDVANEIVRDTARYLGAGIANLLNTFNPDTVVVAGGVTAAGDTLFVPLRAEVRRRAFKPAVQAARIVPGELPGTAGVVGAVASFKQQHLGGV